MGFRDHIKRLLRMCGHAFVKTVHERLDEFQRQTDKLVTQSLSLAETQTALLQASIHIVEELKQFREEVRRQSNELLRRNEEFISAQVFSALRQIHDDLQRQGEEFRRRNEEFISAQVSSALRQIHDDLHRQGEEFRRWNEEFISAQVSIGLKQVRDEARLHCETLRRRSEEFIAAQLSDRFSRFGEEMRLHGEELERRSESFLSAQVMNRLQQIQDELRHQGEAMPRQVSVETSDYEFANPETGLMGYLYSFLPSRRALDVGAHAGDVSESLLRSGYEVYAFEPNPPVYERLVKRLGGHPDFHPFNFALGSESGERTLHLAEDLTAAGRYDDVTVFSSLTPHSMPEDLPFTAKRTVAVRTLAELRCEGVIPADFSLVKIDTEGFDLEVIKGMDGHSCAAVAAEFWDEETPFGKSGLLYTLESLISEMRRLGYRWHIVLYRVWGENVTAFYCNHPRAVRNSWGNVFFFRDYSLFLHGQEWCSATLPRTYFKFIPAG